MPDGLWSGDNIVHIGAALYLLGFAFRDQLMLRAFIIAGDFVYILYFYFAPEEPLWGGIFWSCVFTIVNVWMIGRIVADRTHFRIGEDERRLFGLFDGLTPGEFRRLMKNAAWLHAAKPTVLTEEGRHPDRLFFILAGEIHIDKAGHAVAIEPPTFIGEVAFLLSRPASATVTVAPGARYVAWERASLRRLLMRAPSLRFALDTVLNRDMAAKVARA
jgi:hypothetical protein